jgi:hypothetical protein
LVVILVVVEVVGELIHQHLILVELEDMVEVVQEVQVVILLA